MYASHFGLNALPFSAAAPPESVYLSLEVKEALAHFAFAIENREPFLLLTGEVGSGKTTAIRVALGELRLEVSTAVVSHPTLTPRELVEAVAIGYNLDTDKRESKPKLIQRLKNHFKACRDAGRPALLIFDEAHLLKPAVLEELRLLSNLTRNGEHLVQVFLVGQPELEKRVERASRSLRQRISTRYQLKPLSNEETRRYIVHRLKVAGSSRPYEVFSYDATEVVYELSGGLPREINIVAGYAMLNCFLKDQLQVSLEHARSVTTNYCFKGVTQAPDRKSANAADARAGGTPEVALLGAASRPVKKRGSPAVEELILPQPDADETEPRQGTSRSVLRRCVDSIRRFDLRRWVAGL